MHFKTLKGSMSLFELFAAIQSGEAVDLLHLHPHQRGPVVTAFAIMMTALHRYASSPPQNPAEYEAE